MDWKKLVIASAAFTVLSIIIASIGIFTDMGYYTDPANAVFWTYGMTLEPGPPAEIYLLSLLFALIVGMIYAYTYTLVKPSLKTKNYVESGWKFGLLLFLLVNLGASMSMVLMLAIPLGLQLSWLVQGFVISVLGGIVIAKFMQ